MTAALELVLPYPLSANRYWRTVTPRGKVRSIVTVSEEAKAYKEQVWWLAKQAGVRHPYGGRVYLTVQLYPKRPKDWVSRARKAPDTWDDDVQSIDLDNALKVLIDALKGVVIEDDSRRYVRRIAAEHMVPDGEARVVVAIRPMPTTDGGINA